MSYILFVVHTDQTIRCCDNSGLHLTPRYLHSSCMPISVPHQDPFLKNYATCMEYTGSVTTYRGDCTFGAAEQVNQLILYEVFISCIVLCNKYKNY